MGYEPFATPTRKGDNALQVRRLLSYESSLLLWCKRLACFL